MIQDLDHLDEIIYSREVLAQGMMKANCYDFNKAVKNSRRFSIHCILEFGDLAYLNEIREASLKKPPVCSLRMIY